jgi:hypothetical protein
MDGSTSTFLRDTPPASPLDHVFGLGRSDGILYIEDFDAPPPGAEAPLPEPPPSTEPVFTAADVAAAHEAGRQRGLQAALSDAQLLQAQLQAAATQALADSITATRGLLEKLATQQAENTARTLFAILKAAIPHTMACHAKQELRAVIDSLAPGLRSEPELRVRAHPDLADFVRETLADILAAEGGVLSVSADSTLAPGDIQLGWADGSAKRDCTAIYTEIANALAPLGLPTLEDICHGDRI